VTLRPMRIRIADRKGRGKRLRGRYADVVE
jgi:hypothetical protein